MSMFKRYSAVPETIRKERERLKTMRFHLSVNGEHRVYEWFIKRDESLTGLLFEGDTVTIGKTPKNWKLPTPNTSSMVIWG